MLASLERAREAEHRFVGDASHELRTPLTALRGNAAYVARHGADADGAGRHRGATPPASAALLDDLLALAREDAAGTRPRRAASTSPRSPASAADGDAARRGRRPGQRRGRRAPRRSSARSATSSATRARHGPPDGAHHRGACDGERACSVDRRGPGPDADEAAATPSSASGAGPERSGEGSGLGLAIVRAIAERHGGRVEVDGATFTLDLPALKRPLRGRP